MEQPPTHESPADGPALSAAKVEQVIATWLRLGRNTKATARELGMSRQTVTKYVKHGDPRRGIAPAVGRPDASGGSSGEVADDEAPPTTAPVAAPPPRPVVAPGAPATPPPAPVVAPAPLLPPTGGERAAVAPPASTPSAPKVGTREEADAGMLQFVRLQRQLATARVNETALILKRVKEGVRDPLTGKVMRGRVSQEDREVLALLRDGARVSPMELLKLYETEQRLLGQINPSAPVLGDEDASLDELQREVIELTSGTVNRPEGR